jgi:hypothetical protein
VSAINADTVDFWKAVAADVSLDRPYPGRRVYVDRGRKHKGKRGTVMRHERSRYTDAFRYGGDASQHMTEMRGRYGFRCLVRDDLTGETFWIDAPHLVIEGRERLKADGYCEEFRAATAPSNGGAE